MEEISKWSQTQRSLDGLMRNIYNEVNSFAANFKDFVNADAGDKSSLNSNRPSLNNLAAATASEDATLSTMVSYQDHLDIVRGFQLILKQLVLKQNTVRQQWCDGQVQICNFKFLICDLKTVVSSYNVSLAQLFSTTEFTATSGTITSKIISEIKQLIQRIDADLAHLDKKIAAPLSNDEEDIRVIGAIPFGISGTEYISQKAVGHDSGFKEKEKDGNKSATNKPCIASSNCYVFSGNYNSNTLRIKIHEPSSLISLKIGGCRYFGTKVAHGPDGDRTLSLQRRTSRPDLQINSDQNQNADLPSLEQIKLPCGIGLLECNGDVESTTSIMGDILDWGILLKKNPPDKFLKRPPVRFLFDLFKHIAEQYPGYLPQQIETADWANVGVSKESKTEFMDDVRITLLAFFSICDNIYVC